MTLNYVRKNGCSTAVFWMQKRKREKQPRISCCPSCRTAEHNCARTRPGVCGANRWYSGGLEWRFSLGGKRKPHKGSVHIHTLRRNLNCRTGPSFWTIICCSDQDLVTRSDTWRHMLTCICRNIILCHHPKILVVLPSFYFNPWEIKYRLGYVFFGFAGFLLFYFTVHPSPRSPCPK